MYDKKRKFVEYVLEANFATNTLGTQILTQSLLPVVMKSTIHREL